MTRRSKKPFEKAVLHEKELWKLGAVHFMFVFSYIICVTLHVNCLGSEAFLTPGKTGWLYFHNPSPVQRIRMCGVVFHIGCSRQKVWSHACLYFTYLISSLPSRGMSLVFIFPQYCLILHCPFIITIMVATVGDSIGNELAPVALNFITLLFVMLQPVGSSCLGRMEKRYGTYLCRHLPSCRHHVGF